MKKGFTLVELLAVIVILSIVAIITIPMIKGVIDKVKLGSLEDSVYGLKSAAELYFSSNEKIETTEFICSDNGCISDEGKKLDYKGKVEGKIKLFSDGKVSICLTSDNYASSILANEKKATTKMGGCDEETYEISEVIAIEKYNEIKSDLDSVNNDFLSVKNTLYNKKIITNINNETQLINSDITSYSTGVNNLVDSLYNKTVITSKENTFEQMKSEIDSIELGKSEEQLKNELYNSLQYSGLVTSSMEYTEMLESIKNYFDKEIEFSFSLAHSSQYSTSANDGQNAYSSRLGGYSVINLQGKKIAPTKISFNFYGVQGHAGFNCPSKFNVYYEIGGVYKLSGSIYCINTASTQSIGLPSTNEAVTSIKLEVIEAFGSTGYNTSFRPNVSKVFGKSRG